MDSCEERKLLEMLCQVAEHETTAEAALFFMQSCARTIGARMVSFLTVRSHSGLVETGRGLLWGATERETELIQQDYFGQGIYLRDPINGAVGEACEAGSTISRRHTIADADWYRGPSHEFRHQLELDDVLIAPFTIPGGSLLLTLSRSRNDRPFNDDDAEKLTAAGRGCRWLFRQMAEQRLIAAPSALAPRLEEVLELLLRGDAEKQIAASLGLAPRSVHKYVEQVYRHFEVSSRPELVARMVPSNEPRSFALGLRRLDRNKRASKVKAD